jgi:transcriptional regulator with XRE-family HTH domain
MGENFDAEGFYAAINAVRLSKQMTWKDVARDAGVAASTLSRMGQGAKPDVDGLAALLKWSNLKAESFIKGGNEKEPPAIAQVAALLRADPNLTRQNAKILEEIVISTYNNLRGG